VTDNEPRWDFSEKDAKYCGILVAGISAYLAAVYGIDKLITFMIGA